MNRRLSDVIEQTEKEVGMADRDYYKLTEGDNKVRILSFPAKLVQRWTGSKYEVMIEGDPTDGRSIKWMCYIIDRRDSEVKTATFAHTVIKHIQALQDDTDYAFSDFPMPYDVNIKVKNAGKTDVEYTVVPSPNRTEVPEDALDGKIPCEEIVERMKAKRLRSEGKEIDNGLDNDVNVEQLDELPM